MKNKNALIAAKPQAKHGWCLGLGSCVPTWVSAAPLPTIGGQCG